MIVQASKDETTVQAALIFLANFCIGNDQKLLLWSSGTLNWCFANYNN